MSLIFQWILHFTDKVFTKSKRNNARELHPRAHLENITAFPSPLKSLPEAQIQINTSLIFAPHPFQAFFEKMLNNLMLAFKIRTCLVTVGKKQSSKASNTQLYGLYNELKVFLGAKQAPIRDLDVLYKQEEGEFDCFRLL